MVFGWFKKIDTKRVDELVSSLKAETETEVIKIVPVPRAQLGVTASNFGGLFYLPKGHSIPLNTAGGQLYLLAQLNCGELPPNAVYPPQGIMQFWIDASDDLMGLDFEDGCSDAGKRVIYYPEIGEHYSQEELQELYHPQPADDGILYTPFEQGRSFGLSFSLVKQSVSYDDYRFEPLFVRKWNEAFSKHQIKDFFDLREIDEKIYDGLFDVFTASEDCTQIGGYGFFTQTDIRANEDYEEYTHLLLQIDSSGTGDSDIMWGDMGVGNFFATSQQIKDLDFANCLYNWDCG